MRIFILVNVLLLNTLLLTAQTYIPLSNDTNGLYQLKRQIIKSKEAEIKSITDLKNKEALQKIYTERADDLIKALDSNCYLLRTPLNLYVNTIFNEIIKSNPSLKDRNIRLLINRDAEANALSRGDGTIEINIGLIARLNNESQLAFIICHEISHYILNHSNEDIQKTISDYQSTATKDEINSIAKSKYNQNTRLQNLLTDITLRHRKISRQHEKEADSLGFLYLSNTIYSEAEALTALDILDHIEDEQNKIQIDYSKVFNFPQYPFKSEWLDKSDMLVMVQKKTTSEILLEDSLKTHPDCKIRIVYLKASPVQPNKKIFFQNEDLFFEMKKISKYEVIEYAFYSKRLSYCIYESLKLQMEFPDDSYLVSKIGKSLNIINFAKAKHEVGLYVPLVSSSYNLNYYDLTHLIREWRSTDITNINMLFVLQYYNKFKDEEFLYTSYQVAKANNDLETSDIIHNEYLNKYPNGSYKEKFY
ncbi:MAG: M48 family metallopeptidase [Cytophaga sp.]|uniref:M48 family metallopeptidase n=1 Tax=Cytophaga sp. TaxID=29535 RepID=UPI003F7D3F85